MPYSVRFLPLFSPIIFTAMVVILVIALRWFSYKERMALIAQGLPLEEKRTKEEKYRLLLAAGLILGLLGLALSIGLVTLGIGPWLLVGLIPFFLGLALILTSLVLLPPKPKKDQTVELEPESTQLESEMLP